MLEEILNKINVTGTPARIYTKLIELGPSSARRLAEVLSLPRPSIYDGLKILAKENLVVEREEENKKIFTVNDPKMLSQNIHDQIADLEKIQTDFEKILPQLSERVETAEPKIRFFSGKEGLWKMHREMLWGPNTKIYAVWPIKEVIEVLGKKDFEEFQTKRLQKNIWIDVVWPQNKVVHHDWLKSTKDQQREIRIAPKEFTWNMGYWVSGDKVMFISSKKELFGFVVQSKDFSELMKTQFKILWGQSKLFKGR